MVLGLVLAFVGVLAIWVNRVALDTDNYVDATSQVLESKNVQTVLSNFLVDQLYANVDVAGQIRAVLPPETKGLAGPVAGGLRQVAVQAADRALDTSVVQNAWSDANRRSHEQLILLLDDESKLIRNTGGAVYIDLRPIVIRVGDRAGIGKRLDTQLPGDAGRLVIVRSDQLDTVQTLTRILRFVANWFWVLALLCWAAAIWLARGRRRQALRAIGISVFLLGVLVLIARRAGGNIVVDGLVKNESNKPAVHDVWAIVTDDLRDIGQTILILGFVAIVGTWLAGPGRRATGLRRWLAPYLRERWALVYGCFVTVFLLLTAWAPTGAFRRPWSLLAMAVLLTIGIEALRRETAREFPNAPFVSVGFGERFAAWRGRAEPDATSARPAQVDEEAQRLERLERLATLRQQGALTEEEFASEKAALLRTS